MGLNSIMPNYILGAISSEMSLKCHKLSISIQSRILFQVSQLNVTLKQWGLYKDNNILLISNLFDM